MHSPTVTEEEVQEYSKFRVDVDWHKQRGRSLASLIRGWVPIVDKKTFAAAVEKANNKAIFKSLKRYQSVNPEFIPPDLSIKEAIFRVFITESNKPMTPVEIKDKLLDWWKDTGAYKDVEPHIIKRLLDGDDFYGFREVPDKE